MEHTVAADVEVVAVVAPAVLLDPFDIEIGYQVVLVGTLPANC